MTNETTIKQAEVFRSIIPDLLQAAPTKTIPTVLKFIETILKSEEEGTYGRSIILTLINIDPMPLIKSIDETTMHYRMVHEYIIPKIIEISPTSAQEITQKITYNNFGVVPVKTYALLTKNGTDITIMNLLRKNLGEKIKPLENTLLDIYLLDTKKGSAYIAVNKNVS